MEKELLISCVQFECVHDVFCITSYLFFWLKNTVFISKQKKKILPVFVFVSFINGSCFTFEKHLSKPWEAQSHAIDRVC